MKVSFNNCRGVCNCHCRATSPEPCDHCQGYAGVNWWISESVLAMLWDSIIQRIIVYRWYAQEFREGKISVQNAVQSQRMQIESMLGRISALDTPFGHSDGQQGVNYMLSMMREIIQDPDISLEFNREVALVIDYFENSGGYHIPVYLLAGNGYDYILSEHGIEFIFPDTLVLNNGSGGSDHSFNLPDSDFLRHVFELYKIRETGQYAVLVPPEHVGDNPRIQKPLRTDQLRTVRMINSDNNIEEIRFDHQLAWARLSSAQITVDNHPISAILEAMAEHFQIDDCTCRNYTLPAKRKKLTKRDLAIVLWCLCFGNTGLTFESYLCMMAKIRCWQLSGSIFRRLAHETPRIKAAIWLDRLQGNSQLLNRYVNNSRRGCRTLYEERLEMTLPSCERMYFKGLNETLGPPPPMNQSTYEYDQIYIHSGGILFPRIGTGPSKSLVFTSWKNGVAANPTFTDSCETS